MAMLCTNVIFGILPTLIILFVAIFSSLILYRLIPNFASWKTNIVVERVPEEAVFYPTMKICHSHWLNWFNFTEAMDAGFTMSEILMALSYLTPIYSKTVFTKEETLEPFLKKLSDLNLTDVDEFFQKFIIQKDENIKAPYSTQYEEKFEMYIMCHSISSEDIKAVINGSMEQIKHGTKLTIDIHPESYKYARLISIQYHQTIPEATASLFTPEEYDAYEKSIHSKLGGEFPTKHSLPFIVYPNALRKDLIVVGERKRCDLELKVQVYKWKNTPRKPCSEDRDHMKKTKDCKENCYRIHLTLQQSEFNPWAKLYKDSDKINFLTDPPTGSVFFPRRRKAKVMNTSKFDPYLKFDFSASMKVGMKMYPKCLENCTSQYSCEIWNYREASFACQSLKYTELRIRYPGSMEEQVIRFKEEEFESWESFIGSIGGLFGLWTGASVITCIQTLYLCFCRYRRKKKEIAVKPDQQNPPVASPPTMNENSQAKTTLHR